MKISDLECKVRLDPQMGVFFVAINPDCKIDLRAFIKNFGFTILNKRIATKDIYKIKNLQLCARQLTPDDATKKQLDNLQRRYDKSSLVELSPTPSVSIPDGLKLQTFQAVGAFFLSVKKRALLADDQGLGKTVQTIAALNTIGATKIVIVCPASVVKNWCRELDIWSTPTENRSVKIMSYEKFTKDFENLQAEVFVFDEAHYVKNENSKRGKAFGQVAKRTTTRIWCLTGTPMTVRAADLWAPIQALDPKVFLGFTKFSFLEHFCDGYWDNFGHFKMGGTSNHFELNWRIRASGVMLRRTKAQVLEQLPEKQKRHIEFEPDSATKKKLDDINDWVVEYTNQDGSIEEMPGPIATKMRETGILKTEYVLDYLRAFLDDNPKEKICLFAHHKEVVDRAMAGLKEFNPVKVVGGMPKDARQLSVDTFQTDPNTQVFVGNIKAAGTGLTLTAARYAFFMELSWVPGELAQAEDRIHRITQEREVTIFYLLWDHCFERNVLANVRRKSADISKIIEPAH
jgi:SWI/SNF-related matrix-associated actin-dependent regulator 1 of chromatin subfamily A